MGFNFSDISAEYFNSQEIKAIRATTIGIAGLGGLGSNCALFLARCGFERFVLADFDRVEASNLNRQVYFARHIGRLKTECLAEVLSEINPAVRITAHPVTIDRATVHEIFDKCDCIVEAFDSPGCKALIGESFAGTGRLVVSASGLAGWGASDRIRTRRIRDNFFIIGDEVSAVGGDRKPYAPCVAVAAAKQADVVLEWVLKNRK